MKVLKGLKIFNKISTLKKTLNKSFHIITLGCKINIYESESIIFYLKKNSFLMENNLKNADVIIINTCTVTIKADSKCRNIIRKSRRENPDCLLIVCGCSVDTNLNDLIRMKEIDILIKNSDKDKIYNAINDYYNNNIKKKPLYFSSKKDGSFNFSNREMSLHSRAFLKVQDGCDNYCSFCKIPFARGKSRSRNIDDIFNEINFFVQNNYKEVVLTGINLGSYNYNDFNLFDLIKNIIESFPEIRIRLSSIELQYIDADFIKIFSHKNVCPHLHIPLQSGSDKILKLMNRNYTTNEYYEKIIKIKDIKDNPFISTDLILGFPDESNDDFLKTVAFIKKINFSFIHLFGYSPREETAAYNIKNRICERIRDERITEVKKIVNEMNYNYRERFLNKTLEVIIEKINKEYFIGKSENYINMLIEKNNKKIEKRKKYEVIFTKIKNNLNYAKFI